MTPICVGAVAPTASRHWGQKPWGASAGSVAPQSGQVFVSAIIALIALPLLITKAKRAKSYKEFYDHEIHGRHETKCGLLADRCLPNGCGNLNSKVTSSISVVRAFRGHQPHHAPPRLTRRARSCSSPTNRLKQVSRNERKWPASRSRSRRTSFSISRAKN